MTETRIRLAFADGEYEFYHGLSQINEIEAKCGAGYGEVGARIFAGRYILTDDGGTIGHPEDAKWRIADLVSVIRQGLIGGGRCYVDGVEASVSDYRANELIENYVIKRPKQEAWNLAAAIMSANLIGYTPPGEESPAKAKKPRRGKASSVQKDTQEPSSTAS